MLRTKTLLALLGVLLLAACGDTTGTTDLDTAAPSVRPLAARDATTLHTWQPTTTTTVAPTTTTTEAPPPPPPTTTTTERPAEVRTAAAAPATPAVNSTGHVNGYPCGGDLPTCRVLACESGGNPTAENPRSSASGLWQFLDSTWAGFGGYARASHAPAAVQNEKARQLWAGGAGRSHWASCL